MRRTFSLFLIAGAALATAAPAQAYLLNGCGYGDYTVAEVTVANREIAHVCMSDPPPKPVLTVCLPCIVK